MLSYLLSTAFSLATLFVLAERGERDIGLAVFAAWLISSWLIIANEEKGKLAAKALAIACGLLIGNEWAVLLAVLLALAP